MEREDMFEIFWLSYPRKVGKEKCRRWFASKSRKVDEQLLDEMLVAIKKQKKQKQWQDKQYIPHPYTWLNQGRWEDEILEEIDQKEMLERIANEESKRTGRLI